MFCSTKACCEPLTDPILLHMCLMFSSAMPSFKERRFSGTVTGFTSLSASGITILGSLFFICGSVLHRKIKFKLQFWAVGGCSNSRKKQRSGCNAVTSTLSCYRAECSFRQRLIQKSYQYWTEHTALKGTLDFVHRFIGVWFLHGPSTAEWVLLCARCSLLWSAAFWNFTSLL